MGCERECECYKLLHSLLYVIAISCAYRKVAAAPSDASGYPPGTCISQGGRFSRFFDEGKLPRKAPKGPDDLTLCRVYRKKTCCTSSQTRAALNSLKRLASNGEAENACLELWEVLECAICDPHVGTQPGPPVLCKDFCESVFNSCADAFFSMDPTSQILMPCGPKDTICARAKEWTMNASNFCQLLGFSLGAARHETAAEVAFCFDGRTGAESSAKRSFSTVDKVTQDNDYSESLLQGFLSLLSGLDMGEKILWAIGGLVLTAGAAYWRYGRFKSRRKRAALFRGIQQARARQEAANNAATSRAASRAAKKS